MTRSRNSTNETSGIASTIAGSLPTEPVQSEADATDNVVLHGRSLPRMERAGKPLDSSITEEQVSLLVETFYDRIREHPRLSVLFAKGMTQNWADHLDTMKRFWRSMLMQTREYGGRPVPAHTQLEGLKPDDFAQWLDLFRKTAREICPPAAAALYIDRAETIARNLQIAIFMKGEIVPETAFEGGVLTNYWEKLLEK